MAAAQPLNQRGSRQRRLEVQAAKWLMAAAIVGSVMALGGVHTSVLLVLAGVLGVAVLLAWWGAGAVRLRSPATLVACTALGLALATVAQTVPLPVPWLARLSPAAADIWASCLSALHESGPHLATLTLDPTATRVQALRGVVYLLAFLVALRIARHSEGVVFLERALVAAGVALVIATWLHPPSAQTRSSGFTVRSTTPGRATWPRS